MSNYDVNTAEIIISEEGLDEAIHNAYLRGRNDVLEKVRAEIEHDKNIATTDYVLGLSLALQTINKYKAESSD